MIVEIGKHLLICGDSIDILPHVSASDVNVILTDPPYGVGLGTKSRNQKSLPVEGYKSHLDSVNSLRTLIAQSFPLMQSLSDRIVITPGVKNFRLWPEPTHTGAIYYPSATGCNIWGFSCWQPILYYGSDPYTAAGLGSRADSFSSTEKAERVAHPCAKPIGQWTTLLNRVSLPGESVLDPFMGAGTTGIACISLGRTFIGIEKDLDYFWLAVDRVRNAYQRRGFFSR